MENYQQANKEIWDLGINRRARKLGGNLGQGKGRERKGPTVGGSENNLGGASAWERGFGPCQRDPKSGIPQCEGKTQLQARGPSLHSRSHVWGRVGNSRVKGNKPFPGFIWPHGSL